jgi:DNA-binding NarL/FixJ family response regulator
MRSRLHISLSATSSARRSWLSGFARKHFKQETIRVFAGLQSLRHGASEALEVLIADLATPREATAFVQFLEHSPGAFASVALIDNPEPRWLQATLDAGANSVLSREPDSEELCLAVAAAEAGLVLLHPTAARSLAADNLHPSATMGELSELEELTSREREVLLLMSSGLGNKQIAARLDISEHTAKFHISSILGKLSVGSRTEAVSQGIKRGLIPI